MSVIKKLKELNTHQLLQKLEVIAGTTLPKKGFVTGQSLCSLVCDEIGFINYREKKDFFVNDIDVFQFSKYIYGEEIDSTFCLEKKSSENGYFLDDYSRFIGTEPAFVYKIIDTSYNDIINITTIESKWENLDIKNIISSFDMNNTQIAFDLVNNELIFTDSFLEFLQTGQLKIINVNSPSHAIIRYVKKMDEFGYWGDKEKEFRKCSIKRVKGAYFSNKYLESYKKYEDEIKPYFDLLIINPVKEWSNDWNDLSHLKDVTLYSLIAKVEVFGDFIKFVNNFSFISPNHPSNENFLKICEIYNNYGHKFINSSLNEIEYFKNKYNETLGCLDTVNETILYFKYFDDKSFHRRVFKRLNKLVKKHPILLHSFIKHKNYNDALLQFDIFKKLEKMYGEYIYGYIEDVSLHLDFIKLNTLNFDEVNSFFLELLSRENEDLKEREVESFSFLNWDFTELIRTSELRKEGAEMKHCVGGYSNQVKYNNSIIITAKSDCKSIENFTIELRKSNDGTFWRVSQVQGRCNKPCDESLVDQFTNELKKHCTINLLNNDEIDKHFQLKKQEVIIDGDSLEVPF